MNIYEKIQANYYTTKMDYPTKPPKPLTSAYPRTPDGLRAYADALESHEAAMQPYRVAMAAYQADQLRLNAEFKADAIADVFGDDAQRFPATIEVLWRIAYECGHSSGNSEIYNYLLDYDEVIKAVKKDLAK